MSEQPQSYRDVALELLATEPGEELSPPAREVEWAYRQMLESLERLERAYAGRERFRRPRLPRKTLRRAIEDLRGEVVGDYLEHFEVYDAPTIESVTNHAPIGAQAVRPESARREEERESMKDATEKATTTTESTDEPSRVRRVVATVATYAKNPRVIGAIIGTVVLAGIGYAIGSAIDARRSESGELDAAVGE